MCFMDETGDGELEALSYKIAVRPERRRQFEKELFSSVKVAFGLLTASLGFEELREQNLFDMPRVHLHHRQAAVVHFEDLPVLAPQSRLRGQPFPAVSDKNSVNDPDAVGLNEFSIFWDGLVRISVLQVPQNMRLTFYGPCKLKICTVQTIEADEFYQYSCGRKSSVFTNRLSEIPKDEEDKVDEEEAEAIFSSSWLPEKKYMVIKEKPKASKKRHHEEYEVEGDEDLVENLVLSSDGGEIQDKV